MKKRNKSPCIDICEFVQPNGWCVGCGRTRDECQKWKSMKPYAKVSLEKELARRLSKISTARG